MSADTTTTISDTSTLTFNGPHRILVTAEGIPWHANDTEAARGAELDPWEGYEAPELSPEPLGHTQLSGQDFHALLNLLDEEAPAPALTQAIARRAGR